jgi:branched-chain amino acid aminotransferase
MFGCGTGVVTVQVGTVRYKEKEYTIPTNKIIKDIRDALTGIQRGKIEHGDWSYVVPEWDGAALEQDVAGQKIVA